MDDAFEAKLWDIREATYNILVRLQTLTAFLFKFLKTLPLQGLAKMIPSSSMDAVLQT
jgi:hypothetical protein